MATTRADCSAKSQRPDSFPKKAAYFQPSHCRTTFGFWCGILKKHYGATLWIPHLHKAFPKKRLGRYDVQRRLNGIRELRNRIAHHECILHLDLGVEYANVLDTLDWICPVTRSWIETHSSFSALWQLSAP